MQRAIVTGFKEPIAASNPGDDDQWECPDCHCQVYLRQRAGWVDHFCHKPNSQCYTKLASISQVSPEHELGKKLLGERLLSLFPDARIQLEKGLEKRQRIADVAAIRGETILAAYECQLSPIIVRGKNGLQSRTNDYLKAGIPVSWWFGARSLTATIRNWCVEFYGGKGTWEVIEHPQVRLEGYIVADQVSLKEERPMGNNIFLNDAIIDCLTIEKVDELLQANLQQAVTEGNAEEAFKISTTWNELRKKKARQARINIFDAGEYYKQFRDQILYILFQFDEPKSETFIARKGSETFHFDERGWSVAGSSVIFQAPDTSICVWSWIVGYNLCLELLTEDGLVEAYEEPSNLGSCEVVYQLTVLGREKAREATSKLETLPFKEVPKTAKSLSFPGLKKSKTQSHPISLSKGYVERLLSQVLALFSTKAMTRRELYEEAEKSLSFTEQDKELIENTGNNSNPKWKAAFSHNVNESIREGLLEYSPAEGEGDDIKKRKTHRIRITVKGVEKLKELQKRAIETPLFLSVG
jgi:DNA-binding PadR family transcriptional regulator